MSVDAVGADNSVAADRDVRHRRLTRTLAPASVLLVGASRDATRIGGGMAEAFRRWSFPGKLGFVGRSLPDPAGDAGSANWFTSINEACASLGPVDLVILSIGTNHVMAALDECAAADVGGVVVLANAGGGDDLASLAGEIRSYSQATGLRVIGPSSAGLLDPPRGLPGSLMRRVTTEAPLAGPGVAILSNSGAIANELLWGLRRHGVGISFWMTVGAEADVSFRPSSR
jgi:acyl-CoA synthetase (NDP forming)